MMRRGGGWSALPPELAPSTALYTTPAANGGGCIGLKVSFDYELSELTMMSRQ